MDVRQLPVESLCEVCYGKGKIWKPNKHGKKVFGTCSKCNGTGIKMNSMLKDPKLYTLTEQEEEKLVGLIPNSFYRDKEFSKKDALRDKIYRKIPKNDKDLSMDTLLDFMEDYIGQLILGNLPKKSYFVYSPFDNINKIFVYNAIKNSYIGGLNPSKLLSIHKIYSYLDKGLYSEIDKELIGNTIIFLEVPTTYSTKNHNELAIQYVLEYCDRNGIPLLVISTKNDTALLDRETDFISKEKYSRRPSFIEDASFPNNFGKLEYKAISVKLMQSWYRVFRIQKEVFGEEKSPSELRKQLNNRNKGDR